MEYLFYPVLFFYVGLLLVSCFLVWRWFDGEERVKIVRESTREETVLAIRRGHHKCRILLYTTMVLAIAYLPVPFMLHDHYGTLAYPGIVILADILLLIALHMRMANIMENLDIYVEQNEEHVREAAAQRAREREEWRREAKEFNPKAQAYIHETLGDNYETWYEHDILVGRNVLANMEEGLLYAQGIVIPFSEIMEIRQGRKDLKLVTRNSVHPFITIDFGALPVNPETGRKYKDEIAERLEKLIE